MCIDMPLGRTTTLDAGLVGRLDLGAAVGPPDPGVVGVVGRTEEGIDGTCITLSKQIIRILIQILIHANEGSQS